MRNIPRDSKKKKLRNKMLSLNILESDIEEKFIRSGGKGGQKLNKTSNCVYLKHIPSGLWVKCSDERSRETNRFLARRRLSEKIEEEVRREKTERVSEIEKIRRRKRRRSRRAKNKMLKNKKIISAKKILRRRVSESEEGVNAK